MHALRASINSPPYHVTNRAVIGTLEAPNGSLLSINGHASDTVEIRYRLPGIPEWSGAQFKLQWGDSGYVNYTSGFEKYFPVTSKRGISYSNAVPFKPAETGCSEGPSDADRLWEAAEPPVERHATCLYSLTVPAAPQFAARQQGLTISSAHIYSHATALAALGDGLLVEGAGGLLS